jgi:diaminohydroxyphosphoribosylaminopyrimidine deaminase / 5-amino-6-(5-phosphoribosylamino)uracil reductase
MLAPSPAPVSTASPWHGLDQLAEQSIGLSDPNPRVACRIVTLTGQVFEGHTQAAGQAHAEVMALQAARTAGADLAGATAYVTLEPCSHHGRTPPCCDALVAAGLAQVHVALQDPNPLVAGQGLARLRAAGVEVQLLAPDHPIAQIHRSLNIGFFSRMVRGTPWVRMKMAASLDGTTALYNGQSQWITSEAARHDGHTWRKRAGALLTGIGTVQEDDPRLDVRGVQTAFQPVRVVVDSRLDISPSARILQAPGQAWVYTTVSAAGQRPALDATGCSVVTCPSHAPKVDLAWMLQDLAKRGVNELHVEAGHKLNGSFLREGLVDELLLYLAPKLLGPGAGLANIGPFDQLNEGLNWDFIEVAVVGPDLRIRACRPSPPVF